MLKGLHKVTFGHSSREAPATAETKSMSTSRLLLHTAGLLAHQSVLYTLIELLENLFTQNSSYSFRQRGFFPSDFVVKALFPSVTGARQPPSMDVSFMDEAFIGTCFRIGADFSRSEISDKTPHELN